MKVRVTKAPIYTYLFDKNAMGWTKDPTNNRFFLTRQQYYVNEKLKARGWITLNEVFQAIGLPLTRKGQVVGWVYDKENANCDNFIDFGLNESRHKGVNGAIVLNFNVDGYILDMI